MANLFWKSTKGVRALVNHPFKTEDEFERTVFDNSELLKEIYLLKRQVRGGGKMGIPDIIGIDSEGAVCIVELKNTAVDADIIPQVLQYAIWAETNPDSVKSLWLQAANRPDDIEISWDRLQVRILVIAPMIHRSTLAVVNKINYRVDLIEVQRWIEGRDEFLLVNKLEDDMKAVRARPVTGLRDYDIDFYKAERNKQSVDAFMQYVNEMEQLVVKRGWRLEKKFNRSYCGFKAGFFNAFGINWWGTKTFGIFVKVSESEAARLRPKPMEYSARWKQAYYEIEPGVTRLVDLLPVLEFAYRKLAGTSD